MTIKEKYKDYCNRGIIRPMSIMMYDEDKGFYYHYYYPLFLSEKQMKKEIEKAEEHLQKVLERMEKVKDSHIEF